MASLIEKISARWLAVLEEYIQDGINIDAIESAIKNTLPAIIREESIEYAKERWYSVTQTLQETLLHEKIEKHIVTHQFVENIYKELSEELDVLIKEVVESTLKYLKEYLLDADFYWKQLKSHMEAKMEEERAVIDSMLSVEKRKFINEVFSSVINNIKKDMLELLLGQEADLYASYVLQLVGDVDIVAIIVSDKTPPNVIQELRRELGKDIEVKVEKSEEIVVLIDKGISRIDVSPTVIVDELIRNNLGYIREAILKGVVI